jgi:sugar fermentation stimulation protein A
MKLPPLIEGRLVKRYKRFLADVCLTDGREITAHCPNTGAMTGCAEAGWRVWLSTSDNPKRKYAQTWELVENDQGDLACIHSVKANALVKEAIEKAVIKELDGYESLKTEVKFGEENSRADLLLESSHETCFVEVKSVTLKLDDGLGIFPDAVSDRGRKHLRELIHMKSLGYRAVLFFCVQHSGIDQVAPADSIDPKYAETFRQALAAGVEVLAYRASISLNRIELTDPLAVLQQQPK